MKDLLIQYENTLPTYFDDDFGNAVSKLTSHMKNKNYYQHNRQGAYEHSCLSGNLSTKNFNQSSFCNCDFRGCNLSKVSFVGSKFFNCKFKECDFTSTNFKNSMIYNCEFLATNIFNNTKLGNCKIIKCNFTGCVLNSISFDESNFSACEFKDGIWDAVTTDSCMYINTTFNSVIFKNMNFEFVFFKNIHMNNMKIPFPTIPYIFGGLQYLMTTNDNINITSQHNVKDGITVAEYLSQLHDLEVFYSFTCNYFPLANIYLAQKKYNLGKSSIIYGIKKAAEQVELRAIVNFGHLINFNNLFSMSERHDIYNNTVSILSNKALSYYTEVNRCLFDFRKCMFDSGNDSSFHLYLKTSIDDEIKLSSLLKTIRENIDANCSNCTYNIEIRRNSPIEAVVNLFSDSNSVLLILGILICGLKGIDALINKVLSYIKDVQEIKKTILENKSLEQQNTLRELDIKEKIKDKSDSVNNRDVPKNIYDVNILYYTNNIFIEEVSYIVITDDDKGDIPLSGLYN